MSGGANEAWRASAVAALLAMGGAVIYLLIVWFSLHSACRAYYSTPDVSAFRHFVDPQSNRPDGKTFYFFGSFLLFAAGLVWLFIAKKLFGEVWWTSRFMRMAIACLWTLLILLVIVSDDQRALSAAARIGWHGISQPNSFVATLCIPAAPKMRF